MLKAIVIEDEQLARELLCNYLHDIPFVECVAAFANPLKAIAFVQQQSIDLVFLDIKMPKINGIAFLEQWPQHPMVVFTTAYAEHALKGYEFNTIDYLVKPIPFERFLKACQKALRLKGSDEPKPEDLQMSISIKEGNREIRLVQEELLFVASDGDYLKIHTESQAYTLRLSIKKLLAKYPLPFVRIHKSFAVNPQKVKVVQRSSVVVAKTAIPIGRSFRNAIKEL